MSGAQDTGEDTLLGPFRERIVPERLMALNHAAGISSENAKQTENIAYPIFWLTRPEIKAAAQVAAGPNYVPVHESQAFDCFRPLRVGVEYEVRVKLHREFNPDRLIVTGDAFDEQKRHVMNLRSVLRLFVIPAHLWSASGAQQ